MKKKQLMALLTLASSASVASGTGIIYDGFEYPDAGNPFLGTGPSSVAGAFGTWRYQGNNTIEPRIFNGSLNYTGLPTSLGNKVQLDTTTPTGADASRLYIGNIDKASVPTLYYSFVTSIPSSGVSNQNGAFFAGFDNLTAGTAYTTFAGLFVRQNVGDTAKIDLGISTSGSANKAWSTALPQDTPLFVVASFTFQGVATLDIYTDPTAVPFAEPAHLLTSTGVDASAITAVSNFYVRGNSGQPNAIKIDEVRIGTTWSDVASHALYWDIDGTTAGSGSAAPAGNWDGSTANFNTDSSGGAGTLVSSTASFDSVTFQPDATGTYTVNVAGTQTAGFVNIGTGNVTFAGGTLAVGRFDVAAGATATVSSDFVGQSKGVVKVGDGTLTLSGANSLTGSAVVSAGSLVLESNLTTTGAVSVTNGTLEIASGGGNLRVVQSGSVSVSGGGKLDIRDNKLATSSPIGSHNGTNYTGITGLVESGRNGGLWNGPGITTTMPDAVSGSNYTMLGVATATEVTGVAATDTIVWAGATVTGSDALVMYTYGGDANLSGFVDIDDYGQIDFNASTGGVLTGWFNGDFDYNGIQDIDDYGIIDFVVNIQGAPFATGAAASISAVPEPSASCGFAILTASLLARRRKRLREGSR